jgi:Na+-driven multidrug efflux pump
VIAQGTLCLRIVALGFPFYALAMVYSQAFNGAGDTRTPTVINLIVFWALQLPLAWLLSHHTGLGPSGVFITLAACFSVFATIGVAVFRRGRWKHTRV